MRIISISIIALSICLTACGQNSNTQTDPSISSNHSDDSKGNKNDSMPKFEVEKTDAEWKAQLSEEEYRILRQKGTERAFTGKYYYENKDGIYCCMGCNNPLFKSDTKFDAGCGWPSFYEPITKDAVKENKDFSHGMIRTEVVCGKCGGHLGHVFDDAPDQPTGLRYCINSVSIDLKEGEKK